MDEQKGYKKSILSRKKETQKLFTQVLSQDYPESDFGCFSKKVFFCLI